MPNTWHLMLMIKEKLKLLRYEDTFCPKFGFPPITNTYFAIAINASEQFPYFSNLILWLLRDVMSHDFTGWTEYEDPNSICNSIVIELKKLGLTVDFPIAKLRLGYDEAVCIALNFTLDVCLHAKRLAWGIPQYQNAGILSNNEDHNINENVEIDEDEDVEIDEEFDDGYLKPTNNNNNDDDLTMKYQSVVQQNVLEAKIDPQTWKLELERVMPLLRFKDQQASIKEWYKHLEQSLKHQNILDNELPNSKNVLLKMTNELDKTIERIRSRENHINSECNTLSQDFHSKQTELTNIQQHYNALTDNVSELQLELQAKADAIDLMKSQMKDQNNSMIDNSPLHHITTSLANLKEELKVITLRMGVASQSLLHLHMTNNEKRRVYVNDEDDDDDDDDQNHFLNK